MNGAFANAVVWGEGHVGTPDGLLNVSQQGSGSIKGFGLPDCGVRIVAIMSERGFSQASLAKAAHYDRSLINRVINGSEEASTSCKIRIAQALGVDSRVIWL